MLPFSAAQTALNELLRERLAAAGCLRGCFEVSAPGGYLSLSGRKANGRTLFFWEFSNSFHQLVGDYLKEQYDEHTARLTIEVDVAQGQFQYSHLTKQQQAARAATEVQQATEHRQALRSQLLAYPLHRSST